MLSVSEAQSRVTDLVSAARRAGADAADALYICDASTDVRIRLGQLEDVGRAEGEEIGLRLFVGRRSASVSSSDLSAAALAALIDQAHAMAREAPEDRYAGLAPEDRLMTGPVDDLDLDDHAEPEPAALRAAALAAEDAARAVSGVTNSEGAGASASRTRIALATSHGFAGAYGTSGYGLSASVLAGTGGGMQRDYAYHSTRHLADLDAPQSIGRLAGERAVRRLDPGKLASAPMPVVFDPRVAPGMIGHLIGAITGSAVSRKTSFLLDALDTQVFDSAITIVDDPHRRRGLRSRAFDGEGLATGARSLIDRGVLTGWLMDSASARQLGLDPTGHAMRGTSGPPGVGTSNVHMLPGSLTPQALIADIKLGVYVTELIGMGVNGVTGDYSRGASGYLIEHGEITGPVAEITIAGNLRDMFRALTPADDLVFRYATNTPTLRIDGMTVAGG
ncbi:TldD/PmbA family protein [Sphingomonas sanxanigenens]|uniref:Modulator protein n=1 Tax=Sphingomonas sanxanigenens DSM 19645 = NX02 TaxID=1123269 RepID=W0AFH3_9SPHN|nr:TldD/PmbA family protein [Sphingomonas sanxanigenens]AHE56649.1 hypothetical protein NX02_25210 [Sphingomonas sanxanigenens DSM 19645 = NX02]